MMNPDVIVIGAGAIGLSVAYHLTQAKVSTLLIAPSLTNGVASLAAGAMIDAFGEMDQIQSSLDRLRLTVKVKAQQFYPAWLAQLEAESGLPIFQRSGLFLIGNHQGSNDRLQLQKIRQEMQGYGESYEEVDPRDVPGLQPHDRYPVFETLFLKGAMTVDSQQLLAAIEQAAFNSGYYQRQNDRVTAVMPLPGQKTWQLKTETGTLLAAEKVVVCAGAYSFQVLGEPLVQQAGLPPLYFGRGSGCIVTQDQPLPHGIRTPNRPLAAGVHLLPRAHNCLYFGANNFFDTDLNQPLGSTIGDLHTLFEGVMNQLNTGLHRASLVSSTWGLRPVTPLDQPILGETCQPGLFVATGTHRTGVHYAPIFAQWIVADLQGHPIPDALPFSPQSQNALPPATTPLREGIQALVGSLLAPQGQLPYDRQQQLEQCLETLLKRSFPQVFVSGITENKNDRADELLHWLQEIPGYKPALLRFFKAIQENHYSKLK